jgi:hypothetical protein
MPTQAQVLTADGSFTLPWLNFISALASASGSSAASPAGGTAVAQFEAVAGAPLTVVANTAAADGLILGVVITQDAEGWPVSWSAEFAGVTDTTVPTDPNTTSTYLFIGRSSDGRWISAGIGSEGMTL